jgi:guanidinoacetate N-methyltransferase
MKRIQRNESLEVTLQINNEDFIKPPREFQRNILVTTALKEFVQNLNALDEKAKDFIESEIQFDLTDRTHTDIEEQDIMEDWQIPLMQEMVNVVTETKGDILEIGFGRGISSDMIQDKNVRSHTIVECNGFIIEKYYKWLEKYKSKNISIIKGLWQDKIDEFKLYDGIFFHTYPLNEEDYLNYVNNSITFAEHFFKTANKHLKAGGAFTYFSNEIDSLSRAHQRLLLDHFSSFSIQTVKLNLPKNMKDTWWTNKMVVIKAVK